MVSPFSRFSSAQFCSVQFSSDSRKVSHSESWWWQIKLMLRLTLNLEMVYLIVKWEGKQKETGLFAHAVYNSTTIIQEHILKILQKQYVYIFYFSWNICTIYILDSGSVVRKVRIFYVRSWITLFLLNCVTWYHISEETWFMLW